jgi:hypothetical protein
LFTALVRSGEKLGKRLEYYCMTSEFSLSNLQFVAAPTPMSSKRLKHDFSHLIDDEAADDGSDTFSDDGGDNGAYPTR